MAERTLLSIATAACNAAGVRAPATIVGNSSERARFLEAAINQTIRHMRSMAANNDGWGAQNALATITTSSGTASYDLPGDYDALTPSAMFLSGSPLWFAGPSDPFYWTAVEANAAVNANPYRWEIRGDKLFIQPTPTSVMTVYYRYLTRALIQSTAAGAWDVAVWDQTVWDAATIADRMLTDSDQPRLPDYVVELGIQARIEQRYEIASAPATEAEYLTELELAIGRDAGGPPRARAIGPISPSAEVLFGIGDNGGAVIT